MNKVILIGRLGADPEIRYTVNGAAVCTLSIATDNSYTKDGQKVKETEWTRCVLWNKTAELAGQYLSKGSQVCFEGSLKTRSWDDKKSGEKKYITEVQVFRMEFVGSKGGSARRRAPAPGDEYAPAGGGNGYAPAGGRQARPPARQRPQPSPFDNRGDDDDDIPF